MCIGAFPALIYRSTLRNSCSATITAATTRGKLFFLPFSLAQKSTHLGSSSGRVRGRSFYDIYAILLAMSPSSRHTALILWFHERGIKDVPLVGGKNASLGEMYQKLTRKGIRVPYGFAVTAHAYFKFIREAGIDDDIRRILKGLNTHDVTDLVARGQKVRHTILNAEFPERLKQEIIAAYKKLCRHERVQHVDAAVRSSATAED